MSNFTEILNKFGLEVEEVENSIYKVSNANIEVDIDSLMSELGDCALLIKDSNKRVKKNSFYNTISNIYYVTMYNNRQELNKYKDRVKQLGVATKYLNNYLVWHNLVNYYKQDQNEKAERFFTFVVTTQNCTRYASLSFRPEILLPEYDLDNELYGV